MAEQITLASPANAVVGTNKWIIKSLLMERGYAVNGTTITANPSGSMIQIVLIGEQGHRKAYQWGGATADADIVALNKVNLSAGNTLNKRILDRLIADGVISGTEGGSAD